MARLPAKETEPVFTRKTVGILLVLGVIALAGLRWYIYSDMQALGPERYDVPIQLQHYHMEVKDKELPEGVTILEQTSPGSVAQLPEPVRKRFEGMVPEAPAPRELRLSGYQVPGGSAWVLVGRYGDEDSPDTARSFFHQDHDVAWISGDGKLADLTQAVIQKALRVKRVTVTVEKMKVLGNAYIKFTMELLLGVFFVLTSFILTKYFFIRKQTEGL